MTVVLRCDVAVMAAQCRDRAPWWLYVIPRGNRGGQRAVIAPITMWRLHYSSSQSNRATTAPHRHNHRRL